LPIFRPKQKEPFVYQPESKPIYYAELVDAWRIVPRTILLAYGCMVYWVVDWFLAMPNPTTQQAALVTTVTGTVAAVIGLYQHTGRKWGPHGAMGMVNQQMPQTIQYASMADLGGGDGGRTYDRDPPPSKQYGDE
jgi:hypothetical protein